LQLRSNGDGQAGFSLIEALVSLAVVLAFAGVLGPHLSQSRRIMANADGRVAAQVLLRSLLDAPYDRASPADMARNGETSGLRWRVSSEPIAAAGKSTWQPYRVMASVTWGADQTIAAETIRLRKVAGR
jgi:Tfp pilus assembly protein PilV